MMTIKPIISLTNIRFRWPGQSDDLLHIPHFVANKGEHLFVKGPSGSGKTTLLNLLTGIVAPNSGSLVVLGEALESMNNKERDQFRADHLGIIFQQFNLLPYLSILDNVLLPCGFSKRRSSRAEPRQESARRLLAHLGISGELLDKPVSNLSVGQQQRTAVARALIGGPEIVIADEPTSALDSDNRDRFLDLLFQETVDQGSTLIFVSHDQAIAPRFKHVVNLTDLNMVKAVPA